MSSQSRANFMVAVSVVFGAYSLLWATAPFESINLPARLILDSADWPIDSLSSQLDKNSMFISAIGAGLLGAVSIFLGGIVAPAIREGNKPIIRTTAWAMAAWYLIDGIGSIAAGVNSNVFFNTIYLVLVLIPLAGKTSNSKPGIYGLRPHCKEKIEGRQRE